MKLTALTASCCRFCCVLALLAALGGCAVSTPPAGNDNAVANVNANPNDNAVANDNVAANENDNAAANANDNVAANANDNAPANTNDNVAANDNASASCVLDADCGDGRVCMDGMCADAPAVEFGYTDSATGSYRRIGEGEVMPLFTAGQGGGHVYLTIRLRGFGPPRDGIVAAYVSQNVVLVEDGGVLELHDFTQIGALPFHETEEGSGVYQLVSRFIFLDVVPSYIEGQPLLFTFTVTRSDAPTTQITLEQNMVVELDAE
jgi:hypothetical protein